LFKRTPGSITVKHKQDRTQREQIDSTADVLSKLREWAVRKSQKSKESRAAKKGPDWVPKRKKIEHPVHAMKEDAAGANDDDSSGEESNSVDELLEMLKACPVAEESSTFEAEVVVAGVPVKALLDSGAARSLCDEAMARRLGLRMTGDKRQFRGVGRCAGVAAEPVKVDIGTRSAMVALFVCPGLKVPLLLGRPDLASMHLALGMRSGKVFDEFSHEVVAVSWVEHARVEQELGRDLADFTKSELEGDDVRLGIGQKLVEGLCGHLPADAAGKVWEIMARNREC
jgi:hypothetical protein